MASRSISSFSKNRILKSNSSFSCCPLSIAVCPSWQCFCFYIVSKTLYVFVNVFNVYNQFVIGEKHSLSPPVAAAWGGALVVSQVKQASEIRTGRCNVVDTLFLWHYIHGFPKSPQSSLRRDVTGVSVELKSKPESRVSIPHLHNPIWHQASCSPSIHSVWVCIAKGHMGKYQEAKLELGAHKQQESQEPKIAHSFV